MSFGNPNSSQATSQGLNLMIFCENAFTSVFRSSEFSVAAIYEKIHDEWTATREIVVAERKLRLAVNRADVIRPSPLWIFLWKFFFDKKTRGIYCFFEIWENSLTLEEETGIVLEDEKKICNDVDMKNLVFMEEKFFYATPGSYFVKRRSWPIWKA